MKDELMELARETNFLGRSGCYKCTGLLIAKCGFPEKTISLEPITSRHRVGRCALVVPEEDIDALCEALQKVKGVRG